MSEVEPPGASRPLENLRTLHRPPIPEKAYAPALGSLNFVLFIISALSLLDLVVGASRSLLDIVIFCAFFCLLLACIHFVAHLSIPSP